MAKANAILLFDYLKELSFAFKTDCEELLEAYDRLNSVSYTDFANVWREKGFTNIFAGFNYAILIKHFCENCFYTIKKYIMFSNSEFIKLGAFYMLYGIYYKQTLKTFVKIRVTLEEFQQILRIVEQQQAQGHLDAIYILNKLKADNAFLYVAQRKQLGPEMKFIKDLEVYHDDTFASKSCSTSINKFEEMVNSSELIKDLEKVDNEYQELLKKYSKKCPSVKSFDCSTISIDLRSGWLNAQNGGRDEVQSENTPKTKQKLKQKAMTNKRAVYRGERSVITGVDNLKIPKTRGDASD